MLVTAVLAAFSAGFASPARAGTIRLTDGDGSGSGGGELELTELNGAGFGDRAMAGAPGNVFRTFCLETNESIRFESTSEWTIAPTASADDTLDARTAYLYSRFRSGRLADYDYTPGSGRAASATALQLAIWHLEDTIQPESLTNAYADNLQALAWISEATAALDSGLWAGTGDVRVLSVTENGGERMRLLVMVPLPPAVWLGLPLMAGVVAAHLVVGRKRPERA